jgi:hypothetical protein
MNKGDKVTTDFKSKFLSSAEDMKAMLGSAMCLAKWKQASLHLTYNEPEREEFWVRIRNMMQENESAFFKQHYRSNWHNRGVMTREMDVIRQQESC